MKSERSQCCFCWSARAPVNHWWRRRLSVRLFLETLLSPVKLKRLSERMCACGHWVAEHSGRRKALQSSQPDGRVCSQTRGPQPRKIHRRTETYCYCTYCTWRHTWKIPTIEGSGSPHNTETDNCEAKPKSEHVFYCGLTAWMWINFVLSRCIFSSWMVSRTVTVGSSNTEKHNECTNKCMLCIFYFAVTMHSHTSH